MIARDDLRPGLTLAVANQGIAITYQWRVVVVRHVSADEVFYTVEPFKQAWRRTPIERFLEIVNAPPRGPHHTPKPEV